MQVVIGGFGHQFDAGHATFDLTSFDMTQAAKPDYRAFTPEDTFCTRPTDTVRDPDLLALTGTNGTVPPGSHTANLVVGADTNLYTDNFDDGSLGADWHPENTSGAKVITESGGVLKLAVTNVIADWYPGGNTALRCYKHWADVSPTAGAIVLFDTALVGAAFGGVNAGVGFTIYNAATTRHISVDYNSGGNLGCWAMQWLNWGSIGPGIVLSAPTPSDPIYLRIQYNIDTNKWEVLYRRQATTWKALIAWTWPASDVANIPTQVGFYTKTWTAYAGATYGQWEFAQINQKRHLIKTVQPQAIQWDIDHLVTPIIYYDGDIDVQWESDPNSLALGLAHTHLFGFADACQIQSYDVARGTEQPWTAGRRVMLASIGFMSGSSDWMRGTMRRRIKFLRPGLTTPGEYYDTMDPAQCRLRIRRIANVWSGWVSVDQGVTWTQVGNNWTDTTNIMRWSQLHVEQFGSSSPGADKTCYHKILDFQHDAGQYLPLDSALDLLNQSPAPLDIAVPVDSSVYLEIIDSSPGGWDLWGLDPTSVNIWMTQGAGPEVAMVLGGVAQAGYSLADTPITAGYSYNINPAVDLGYEQLITIRVHAINYGGVALDESYSFNTETQFTLSSDIIDDKGGTELVITAPSKFSIGEEVEIHLGLTGTTADALCYGGPGYGYRPISVDGDAVHFASPPATVGANMVTVVHGAPPVTSLIRITVVEHSHKGKAFGIRAAFPPWTGVGGRSLERES
jgi:hypothetical protein